jgi:Uma2 family endonuclease
MSTLSTKPITAEALLELGDASPCELVQGEIIHMTPPGFEHGDIAVEIAYRIKSFIRGKGLGKVVGEAGFVLARNPDTVRSPDVAFVRRDRAPAHRWPKYFDGAPDLAIEVVSPWDSRSEVAAKVDQWLAAGTQSVWIIDPPNRSIEVYRVGNKIIRYRDEDELRDEPVLPGFALKLAEFFDAE